jgi:hypothetical protein
MARVRSTACSHDDVPAIEGEGAVVERAIIDEGHDIIGSSERTELAHASDAGSQGHDEGDSDEGSCTHSYYFGPLTIIVCRIWEMIDQEYFIEGGARASGEETIPEPDSDKDVIFEEFFTIGLRIPPHPGIGDILLKVQVQLHQLTPMPLHDCQNMFGR